jgi:hypothetical protein
LKYRTSTFGKWPFTEGPDEFRWNLHENGKFSGDSMYNALIQPDFPIDKNSNDKIWKLKLPLRFKVFGWYLWKGDYDS